MLPTISTPPDSKHVDVKPTTPRTRRNTTDAVVSVEPIVSRAAPVGLRKESRIDSIARRAHEIYGARGGEHGKALEDWLQAEREIDAMSEPTS